MNPTTEQTKLLHRGARMERTAILKMLRRNMADINSSISARALAEHVIRWLLERNERYEKRKGGLGRPRNGKR